MVSNNWNAALYDDKHSFVYEYGKQLLGLLEPAPGETILDLGCGTGHLTASVVKSGAAVVGVDSSIEMIEKARTEHPGIDFRVVDARYLGFSNEFDAVFSNAVLHWILEADQVATGIAAALKPGGRFVADFGGKNNCRHGLDAMKQAVFEITGHSIEHGWYFPAVSEYTSVLENAGLEVTLARLYERPTRLEDGDRGLRNWIEMFNTSLFDGLTTAEREHALMRTEEIARKELFRDGSWYIDYRRLQVVAVKEERW